MAVSVVSGGCCVVNVKRWIGSLVPVWVKGWIEGHIMDFVKWSIHSLCQLLNMDRLPS